MFRFSDRIRDPLLPEHVEKFIQIPFGVAERFERQAKPVACREDFNHEMPSVIVRQGTVLCLAPDEVSLRGESSPDARKGSAACAQEQGSVEAAEILQGTDKRAASLHY